jgi:hypothetical protein
MDFRFTLSHTPRQSVSSNVDLPDNADGLNIPGVGSNWTEGSSPSVAVSGSIGSQSSDTWANDFTFGTGLSYTINYSLNYNINVNVISHTVTFVVLDGANNVLHSDIKNFPGTGVGTLNESSTFTAPGGAVKYGFFVTVLNILSNAGSTFTINGEPTGTVSTQAEPGVPTSIQISEPDGWKQCKLTLERHEDFSSLVEYYEGGAGGAFIFYGDNGQENGGIDFLKGIEQIYGFDAQVSILTEFSFDSVNYEEIFLGQIDISAKDEMVDNLMQAPIIRDDFWAKFINRRGTQIDLSSNVDLDGQPVSPAMPITVNLPSQKIRKEYSGTLTEGKTIYEDEILVNEYIQYDFDNEILSEIDTKYNLFIASNPAIPVDIIEVKEAGTYDIDLRIEMSIKNHGGGVIPGCAGLFVTDPTSAYINVFVRINNADTQVASTDVGGLSTVYAYTGSFDLNVGDQIRVYAQVTSVAWKLSNSVDSILIYGDDNSTVAINTGNFSFNGVSCVLDSVELEDRSFTIPSGAPVPTYLTISANTVYPESTAQGFLIHDLFYAVLQRIGLGKDPFYSEFLGSTLTNYRQYSDNGCGWMYAIIKGLQIRQYTLAQKPFFISFNQIWEGIHPILCLGLAYEEMDDSPGSRVLRIEQMDHFFSDEVSVNFSNVRDIHSYYDNTRIFKTVKTGYKKWQSEDISGIDDPQTKHSYALRFEKVGKDLTLESDFIAASLAIEVTRRKKIEKSEDYKYDNDNFIIAISENDISPDRYVPELDENFDSVSGLLNSDTRYNLILSPMRNLLRWAKFLGGCLQSYTTSAYRFVSGEGNYNMLTDYSCASGNQCQAVICDPLSERQDISLSAYNSVFGYLHLAQECEMTIPMEKSEYDIIKNNPKKSIGISQTDSNFTKFKIKKLVYNLIEGTAIINAWPKTPFRIQVINDPIEMPDCEPEVTECIGDDLRLTEDSEFRITEDGQCRELELIN